MSSAFERFKEEIKVQLESQRGYRLDPRLIDADDVVRYVERLEGIIERLERENAELKELLGEANAELEAVRAAMLELT